MGVHIEAQYPDEVVHIKSRELQMENTEKLNNIVPVVETINDVNLLQIETDTSEIKDMVSQNLDEQPDIEEVLEAINALTKGMSTIKGQLTKLSNNVKKMSDNMSKINKAIKENTND